MFWTRNWSTRRISILQNQNYSLKTSAVMRPPLHTFMCIYLSTSPVFNTKNAIAEVLDKLLDQHEEPFKSITK